MSRGAPSLALPGGLRKRSAAVPSIPVDRVTVATCGSVFEAEVTAARLRAGGVDAFVAPAAAGGAYTQLALIEGVRVTVPLNEVPEAFLVLDGDGDPDEQSPGWSRRWLQVVAVALVGALVVPALVRALVLFV